jgi:N-methylhydantoinase A
LSAAGLLAAPVEHQAAVAFNAPVAQVTREKLAQVYSELDARCDALMMNERVAHARIERHYLADVCYIGQSYHLEVALDVRSDDAIERLTREFYEVHDRIYGHSAPGPIQFVNLRAVHQAQVGGGHVAGDYTPVTGDAFKSTRSILTAESGTFVPARVYERSRIAPGTRFEGPAIVEQSDTTTVVDCGWLAEMDSRGNLILSSVQ